MSLVTAVEMTLLWWLRRFFAAPLPTIRIPLPQRWAEPIMLVGAMMAAASLWVVAAAGFAPDGKYPWMTALVFALGLTLVACRPAKATLRSVDTAPESN
uniref:Uncharacterized protein n=1 Tax=Mycobacterium kansasii TaxID=1768 RepID=A0A653EXN4_MYCKA|nr:hypothetical protein BIN_B_03311 [Mycobacterium kansasii]